MSKVKKDIWNNRKVLVTGGAGLLGSELVSELVERGSILTLIVRDRVTTSRIFTEGFDEKVNLVYGDIVDFSLVERSIGEYEVDTIFHLAAQTIVGIANTSPLSTFESNIKGTWNVLEAARLHKNDLEAIIVASSDKAYGDVAALPYTEDTPLMGRYPYDASKACTDILAQTYWKTYGLPVSITRCGNLFGPGDFSFSRLIPSIVLSLLNNERPVLRSDGKFSRNFFYTKDAVDGYLTVAENIEKAKGEAFNLGTEERYTVLEITQLIIDIMGKDLKPLIKNQAKNEIRDQYLSISKAKEVLGWAPKYKIKNALEEVVDWYRKNV